MVLQPRMNLHMRFVRDGNPECDLGVVVVPLLFFVCFLWLLFGSEACVSPLILINLINSLTPNFKITSWGFGVLGVYSGSPLFGGIDAHFPG